MSAGDESMVERVARAMCAAQGHDPDSDWRITAGVMLSVALAPGDEKFWRTYEPHARTAIAAMREPTAMMLYQGEGHADLVLPEGFENTREARQAELRMAYQVMIDAALNDGGAKP